MDELARKLMVARGDELADQQLINKLSDTSLLIIDDFLTVDIDPAAGNDLFGILANREHRLPTNIASQTEPDYWAQALPDRVAADSIVTKLANNARKLILGDLNMRLHPDHRVGAGPQNRRTNPTDSKYQQALGTSNTCQISRAPGRRGESIKAKNGEGSSD